MTESRTKRLRPLPLPHPRADCPVNAFFPSVHDASHSRNLNTCETCYCLICDCRASDCSVWHTHCMAYYTHPDWRAIRGNKTTRVASYLLPPCIITNSNNATLIDLTVAPNSSRENHTHLVRDVIDLESGDNQRGNHCQRRSNPCDRKDFIDLDSENNVSMKEIVEIEPTHLDLSSSPVSTLKETTASLDRNISQTNCGRAFNDVSIYDEVSTLQLLSETGQDDTEQHNLSKPLVSELSSSAKELKALRQLWQVSRIYPIPQLFLPRCKQPGSAQTAEITGSFSSLLIGHIDMWRPYCSHMSASNIEFSCVHHQHDVASVLYPRQMRVPGAKSSHISVLATEMGLDLRKTALLEDFDVDNLDETLHGLRSFVNLSSVCWKDGSPMPPSIRKELHSCIQKKLLKIRWELSHYPGAANKQKAFAHSHKIFRSFDAKTRAQILKDQLAWLDECKIRAQRFRSFTTSNCCLLRAWVYLSPSVLHSNMVTAASFCAANSVRAYMKPIDGGQCLAEKLSSTSGFVSDQLSTTSLLSPNSRASLENRIMSESRGLDCCKSENSRKSLMAVMSALRCNENTFISPISPAGIAPRRFSTMLQASATHLSQPFHTLCQTYNTTFETANRTRNEKLVESLRKLSSKDDSAAHERASISGILSSSTFTVSEGYLRSEEQPPGVKLPLLRYQKETLAWMLDQEKARSISDPFWLSVHGLSETGDITAIHYCPLSGYFSEYPPPPVVGGVLAEEMGLGKTIIAISLILQTLEDARSSSKDRRGRRTDLESSHCTLIICSTSLLDQWQIEIERHVSTKLKVLCWYSKRVYDPKELAKHDIVLTTYGVVCRGYMNALLHVDWHRIILDECTEIKDPEFDRQRKHLELELVSRRRWAVSGTPFGNDFKQAFFPIIRFLGVVPFSSKSVFRDVSELMTRPLSDAHLTNSLIIPKFIYLMKNIMMRHVKKQEFYGKPLIQLPAVLGECVWVYLGLDEKKEYGAFERMLKGRLARSSNSFCGSEIIELSALIRQLRMKADGVTPKCRAKDEPKFEGDDSDYEYDRTPTAASAKVRQLIRDVKILRSEDLTTKIVVYTEFNQVRKKIQSALENVGISVLTLDGSLDAHKRGNVVRTFEEDLDATVLILTLNANKCGLNLTMANIVILFEVGLNHAVELQAVNRIHRIGQTRAVKIMTYVSNGTIDERIMKVRQRRGYPRVVGLEEERNGHIMSTLEVYRYLLSAE